MDTELKKELDGVLDAIKANENKIKEIEQMKLQAEEDKSQLYEMLFAV